LGHEEEERVEERARRRNGGRARMDGAEAEELSRGERRELEMAEAAFQRTCEAKMEEERLLEGHDAVRWANSPSLDHFSDRRRGQRQPPRVDPIRWRVMRWTK
jgi:hypothetical protein